jgi:hypothetical protein
MYPFLNLEKRLINANILTRSTMLKDFVTTVITVMDETKSLGIVNMMFFTLLECVKTATLTDIIRYIIEKYR